MDNDIIDDDNLYSILNIDNTASYEEIKKAYRKLALKYHPDKLYGNKEQFIKIHAAYEVLSNHEMKIEYDNMHNTDKQKLYINIFGRDYWISKSNIDEILLSCQGMSDSFDDEKYVHHVHKQNYNTVFTLLMDSLFKKERHDLDIVSDITCDLMDRYLDKYMRIEVKRKTRKDIELYIPLRNDITVFYDEGEIDDGRNGDIILNVVTKESEYYVKDGDMYTEIKIDEILDVYKYRHIDGNEYDVNKDDIIDGKFFIIKNIALIKDNGERGDLVIGREYPKVCPKECPKECPKGCPTDSATH
jgi:DnaJ-class molecular chaperone